MHTLHTQQAFCTQGWDHLQLFTKYSYKSDMTGNDRGVDISFGQPGNNSKGSKEKCGKCHSGGGVRLRQFFTKNIIKI